MVFDAARAAGWVNAGQRLDHVGFGVVCGDDGKRFKTRSSETVKLIDLLDEAKRRMHEALKSRVEEGRCDQCISRHPTSTHTHTHTHTLTHTNPRTHTGRR